MKPITIPTKRKGFINQGLHHVLFRVGTLGSRANNTQLKDAHNTHMMCVCVSLKMVDNGQRTACIQSVVLTMVKASNMGSPPPTKMIYPKSWKRTTYCPCLVSFSCIRWLFASAVPSVTGSGLTVG